MSESETHIRLVKELRNWIVDSLLEGDAGYIYVDLPNGNPQTKPQKIGNYRPDVCVPNAPGNIFIIGEAKTTRDLERKHSIEQFRTYLVYCAEHVNSILVLAVPWHQARLAGNIINTLKKQIGADKVKTKVLERLSG